MGPQFKATTTAGKTIAHDVDKYPYVVLNNNVRTHSQGSALDLAIFHVSLVAQSEFSIHSSLELVQG